VNVVFDDATGLEKDASVQIAGVEVGRVESISLKDGKAFGYVENTSFGKTGRGYGG